MVCFNNPGPLFRTLLTLGFASYISIASELKGRGVSGNYSEDAGSAASDLTPSIR